jgi:hypothetical protein
MIKLERSMNHRWIIDKNVNSKDILSEFANIIKNKETGFDFDEIKSHAHEAGAYRGRSEAGSTITIGVRLLQACFYMFGYSYNMSNSKKVFIPSPMTLNILSNDDEKIQTQNYLVNLFSLQYPQPFNWTPSCFQIYVGRLFVKLLLDERLNKKLYIDECIWFLPFIEKLTQKKYDELVSSILEFRALTYEEKLALFMSIKDYNYLFANVTHEMNYYFIRLFSDFGVFDILSDPKHNDGKLFKFRHGNSKTYRTDAWQSRAKNSGYIELSKNIIQQAQKLISKFSAFEIPTKEGDEDVLSRRDWLTSIYEVEPLAYINCIDASVSKFSDVSSIVNKMVHASKFGSRDGKEFENALKPFLELFRESVNVEILSGAGKTDLLCTMEENTSKSLYKMNVDAKTRNKALEGINPIRITSHINKTGSKFCMIVAPKFARGVASDINQYKIVAIRSEELGVYCYRECMSSKDGYADFSSIYDIILNNLGSDITSNVQDLIAERYGIGVQ